MPKPNMQKLDNTIMVRGRVITPEQSERISTLLNKKYATPGLSNTDGAVLSRVLYPIVHFGNGNGNGRIYDREIYTDNVLKDSAVLDKLKMRNMFMQEEHPPEEDAEDKTVTSRIAGIVCDIIVPGFNDEDIYGELDLDQNDAYAIVDVLNTPMGQIVDTLIRAGAGFGVSTRANGKTESVLVEGKQMNKVVPGSYVFETIDFTATPSTSNVLPVLVEKKIIDIINEALKNKDISIKMATALLETCKTPAAQRLRESLNKTNEAKMKKKFLVVLKDVIADSVKDSMTIEADDKAEARERGERYAKTYDGEVSVEVSEVEQSSEKEDVGTDLLEARMIEYMQSVDPSLKLSEHLVGSLPNKDKLNESSDKGELFIKQVKFAINECIKRIAVLEAERDTAMELLNEALVSEDKAKVHSQDLVGLQESFKISKAKYTKETAALKEEIRRLGVDLDGAMTKVNESHNKAEKAAKLGISKTKAVYEAKLKALNEEHKNEIVIIREGMDRKLRLACDIERRIIESGLKLPSKTVALLRESKDLVQLDESLKTVREKLREGMHSRSEVTDLRLTETKEVVKKTDKESFMNNTMYSSMSKLIEGTR